MTRTRKATLTNSIWVKLRRAPAEASAETLISSNRSLTREERICAARPRCLNERGASWPREHGNSVLAQCRVGGIVWPSKDALRLCAGALYLGCNSPAMVSSGGIPARPMGVEGTVGATMASSCAKRSENKSIHTFFFMKRGAITDRSGVCVYASCCAMRT